MSRILLGVICGLVFGVVDIAIMLTMSFPDKKAAITAAFIARFGIGFVIGATNERGWREANPIASRRPRRFLPRTSAFWKLRAFGLHVRDEPDDCWPQADHGPPARQF